MSQLTQKYLISDLGNLVSIFLQSWSILRKYEAKRVYYLDWFNCITKRLKITSVFNEVEMSPLPKKSM